MRKAKFVLVTMVALMASALGPPPLYAENRGVPVDQVHPKSVLIALAQVPVRDGPPAGGAVYAKGRQTGALTANEVITVSEERIVPTLLGDQKWVRFSRAENLIPSNGWVLVGTAGTTSKVFDERR